MPSRADETPVLPLHPKTPDTRHYLSDSEISTIISELGKINQRMETFDQSLRESTEDLHERIAQLEENQELVTKWERRFSSKALTAGVLVSVAALILSAVVTAVSAAKTVGSVEGELSQVADIAKSNAKTVSRNAENVAEILGRLDGMSQDFTPKYTPGVEEKARRTAHQAKELSNELDH